MKVEKILDDMHATHNYLMGERDRNGSNELLSTIQRHSEAIMWLDKHAARVKANSFYRGHPSGVGPGSIE